MHKTRGRTAGGLTTALMLGLLAACGGGGSGGSTPPPATPPPSSPPPVAATIYDPSCALSYQEPTNTTRLTGLDPLRADQWHLANNGRFGTLGEDIRVEAAWPITKGSGVRVAVVDDAIEVTHADLWPNVAAGASHNYYGSTRGNAWPLPCTRADDHGTAVTGLIAAKGDNAIGGLGVAPEATLVGYNAIATMQDVDVIDALGRDLQANAVYNNSWGSPDDGTLQPAPPSFTTAIREGLDTGRGGKGAIYLFPAGNGGCYVDNVVPQNLLEGRWDEFPCIRENANYDGYTSKLGTIAVCAVNSDGHQPFYGENGANLLVCAPSSDLRADASIRTTALKDGYRSDFTGTSASTPIASGVVALMLAANPALTWRDVRLILARTARKNDTTPRLVDGQPFDAGWTTADGQPYVPSALPATEPQHSHRYGFGVVDAGAAVAAAKTWPSVGGSSTLKTCVIEPDAPNRSGAIAEYGGVESSQPVLSRTADVPGTDACRIDRIEFAELRLTTLDAAGTGPHPSGGDLEIRLTSPNGRVSQLADPHPCYNTNATLKSCGSYDDFAFGSVRHLDEPAVKPADGADPGSRTWTLSIRDLRNTFANGQAGRLAKWSLTLYGRAEP